VIKQFKLASNKHCNVGNTRDAFRTPFQRWHLVFPMHAGGEKKHVLNCTGSSWRTRNYTVFISRGSRTAFRGAYRNCDASFCTVRQWNHTVTSFTESILSMCFAIGWTRFHEHEHAIPSPEERVRKCKPLLGTCSLNMCLRQFQGTRLLVL